MKDPVPSHQPDDDSPSGDRRRFNHYLRRRLSGGVMMIALIGALVSRAYHVSASRIMSGVALWIVVGLLVLKPIIYRTFRKPRKKRPKDLR